MDFDDVLEVFFSIDLLFAKPRNWAEFSSPGLFFGLA